MSSAATQRWKNWERGIAELLTKYGIPAKRISRGQNYSLSTFDVEIEGHPEIKNDGKYSTRGFKTSRLLDEIELKYCKEPGDIPVLWCKAYKEKGGKVTIDAEFFCKLLKVWFDKNEQLAVNLRACVPTSYDTQIPVYTPKVITKMEDPAPGIHEYRCDDE